MGKHAANRINTPTIVSRRPQRRLVFGLLSANVRHFSRLLLGAAQNSHIETATAVAKCVRRGPHSDLEAPEAGARNAPNVPDSLTWKNPT